jgi:hypothetical protein
MFEMLGFLIERPKHASRRSEIAMGSPPKLLDIDGARNREYRAERRGIRTSRETIGTRNLIALAVTLIVHG